MALQHLRSSTANKRPTPAGMSDGQLALNTNDASPGLFFKDSNGALVKVGPVHVGTTAPNATPGSGGSSGNAIGEQWLDTTGGTYVFKVWDGSAWRSESGTFVDVNGDVMTGALGIIAGTAGSPGLYFSGDTNTGLYSPGADQVAISTGGSGRLFVDASGRIIVGAATAAIGIPLEIVSNAPGLAVGVRGRSADNIGIIGFYPNNSSTEYARIQSNGDSSLSFGTGPSGSERLRITSAGLVGVGASSAPGGGDSRMWIDQAGTNDYGLLINASGGVKQPTLWLRDASATLSGKIVGQSGLTLATSSSATAAITIDTSQRVGVGTTSPTGIFEACGSSSYFRPAGAAGTFLQITAGAANGDVTLNASANSGNYPPLVFSTGGGEKVRIDSSGRLLVGTSSARANFYNSSNTSTFQVEGTNAVSGFGRISSVYNDNSANGGSIIIGKTRGASIGAVTAVSDGDSLGSLSFQGADGAELVEAASIGVAVDGTPGANDMPGRLVFSVTPDGSASPVERMRLSKEGQFFTFSTGEAAFIQSALAAGATDNLIYGRHSASATTGTGTASFMVRTNGNVVNTNNSYGAISDIKFKENIVDAASQWDDIKAVQVRKYNFKKETGQEIRTQIGLVAQEVELVSPGLVSESPDRDADGNDLGTVTKSVNYSVLYMKAVKALQEAMERIEQLEQRLTDAGIA